ncbi:hypothetical protein ACFYNX_27395 [Streptomyces sp. NPDC007872]|uniref:hypothetical protein n=1 Tax=Streptomyces sp. NPDC007872 TaxID=3364782 RepID=UPI00368650A0
MRCVALAAVLCCPLPQAHATQAAPRPVVEVLPPERVRTAVRAAHTPTAVNLARSNLGIPARATDPLYVTDHGVCVYRLNPSFRQGRSDVPLAVLGYVAVTARTSDGRTTTLQVAPVPSAGGGASSWAAVAAAQDDTEARLAQGLDEGAVLFEDQGPRGREWYALDQRALRLLTLKDGRPHRSAALSIAAYTKSLRQPTAPATSAHPAARHTGTGTEVRLLLGAVLLLATSAFAALLRSRSRSRRPTVPVEDATSS